MRPHALRREAPQGPGAGRPLLRRDPSARGVLTCRSSMRSCGSSACSAKTKHNEVAPGAARDGAHLHRRPTSPPTTTSSTMEIMKKVAERHGLVCLLHEKPFAGVNGSRQAQQLVACAPTPARTSSRPRQDAQRERAVPAGPLRAFIKAVDEYQDLLRMLRRLRGQRPPSRRATKRLRPSSPSSSATELEGDHRRHRRPTTPTPRTEHKSLRHRRARAARQFPQDTTDRNRTSPVRLHRQQVRVPYARLLRSPSPARTSILNTIDGRRARRSSTQTARGGRRTSTAALHKLIQRHASSAHRRIIFNGNGYEEAWVHGGRKARPCQPAQHRRGSARPTSCRKISKCSPARACIPARRSSPAMKFISKSTARSSASKRQRSSTWSSTAS